MSVATPALPVRAERLWAALLAATPMNLPLGSVYAFSVLLRPDRAGARHPPARRCRSSSAWRRCIEAVLTSRPKPRASHPSILNHGIVEARRRTTYFSNSSRQGPGFMKGSSSRYERMMGFTVMSWNAQNLAELGIQ